MNATHATNAMHDHPLIWAEIDLDAIANNVRELRRRTHSQAKVMAVVKANGYGHGLWSSRLWQRHRPLA